MGKLTKLAIEIGVKEHLRIVEKEQQKKLTASLWIAGYGKSFVERSVAAYNQGGAHPDITLYDTFMELAGQPEEFGSVRYVYLYSHFCPCYNCKDKWKKVPGEFSNINFKWAFCQWYIPPPDTSYDRYASLEKAEQAMAQMVGLGWSMRQYSTTITDNALSSIKMVAKIQGPKS